MNPTGPNPGDQTIERFRGFVSDPVTARQIDRATEKDREAIRRIRQASNEPACPDPGSAEQTEGWTARRQIRESDRPGQPTVVLVAKENESILGFAELDLSTGVIEAFYVDPQHTGRGIGRGLLAGLEDEARRASLKRLELSATLHSVAFYRARGFQVLRNGTQVLADEVAVPCVHMERWLDALQT